MDASKLIGFTSEILNDQTRKRILDAILSDDPPKVLQMLNEICDGKNLQKRTSWFADPIGNDGQYLELMHDGRFYFKSPLELFLATTVTLSEHDYLLASPLEIAIRANKKRSLHVLCTEMLRLQVASQGMEYRKVNELSWYSMYLASKVCPEPFEDLPQMLGNVAIWNLLLLCLLRENYDAYRELVRAGFNEFEVNPYYGEIGEEELYEALPAFLKQLPEPVRALIGIPGITALTSDAAYFLRARPKRADELLRRLRMYEEAVVGSDVSNWRALVLPLLEEKHHLDGNHVWAAYSARDPMVLARVFELGGPINAGVEDETILTRLIGYAPDVLRQVWFKAGAAGWPKTDASITSREATARLLMHAFLRQAKSLVFDLLDSGASIDDFCHHKMNVPIRRLLSREHLEWVGQWRQLRHPQVGDALLEAIHDNDLAKARALLPKSGDINVLRYSARFGMLMTALSAASFCRLPAGTEMLELLLSAGAAANECDAEGIPAVIRAFAAVAPIGRDDADPLELAFRRLDLLIQYGADPRQADAFGENLLHHAAVRFRATNPVEFGNASWTAATGDKWQALALQSALWRLCAQYKIDPNAQDKAGNTIAHLLVLQLAQIGASLRDDIDQLLAPETRTEDYVVTLGSLALCDLTIRNGQGVLPFDMIDHQEWANSMFKFANQAGDTESSNILMQMVSAEIFKRQFRAEPRLLMAMLQPFNIDDYSHLDFLLDYPGISKYWKLGISRHDDVSEGWAKRADEIRLVLEGKGI